MALSSLERVDEIEAIDVGKASDQVNARFLYTFEYG